MKKLIYSLTALSFFAFTAVSAQEADVNVDNQTDWELVVKVTAVDHSGSSCVSASDFTPTSIAGGFDDNFIASDLSRDYIKQMVITSIVDNGVAFCNAAPDAVVDFCPDNYTETAYVYDSNTSTLYLLTVDWDVTTNDAITISAASQQGTCPQ